MTKTIKANATMTAINTLVLASLSYDAAMDKVRAEFQADRLTREDARIALAMAYCHHAKAKYDGQRDAETGKPVRNSALEKKVNRDLSAITAKDDADKVSATRDDIAVPKHIQALADALAAACNEYEGARKLGAKAIANAFAAK